MSQILFNVTLLGKRFDFPWSIVVSNIIQIYQLSIIPQNIFTIYLAYYWKNKELDYWTVSAPIVSKAHDALNKKHVTNCTAFIDDFFSDIINWNTE